MAFIKKLWKDRISQFPNRRTINDGSVTKQVTVGRDEGTITEQGDSFDAANMNDLEQRIEDAYGDVVSLVASEVAVQYHGDVIFDNVPTTSHGVGYAVTSDGLKTALDGKANTSDIPDELNDLSDVNITSPTQGEALVFDADGNIVNGTVSTVGNLDDLSDVDTTGKQDGDSLRYIGGEWKAKPTTVEMTQAEYDLIVDFTPYENTHIVITDAPNLNPTASDIEYSSGVTVADKLTSLDTNKVGKWQDLGSLSPSGTGIDVSGYSEILIILKLGGSTVYNSWTFPETEIHSGSGFHCSVYESATAYWHGRFYCTQTTLTYTLVAGEWNGASITYPVEIYAR